MTRRALLLILAAVSVTLSVVVFHPGTAAADTEVLEFAQEGTFWRLQPRAPIVDIPCQAPIPADRCGQVAPTAGVINAPNVLDGNMVVGHAGGQTGDDKGDQFWIVTQPDVSGLGEGATVEKATITLTVAPDARGDFNVAVIKGCNVVVPFGVSEGSNPWDDRPAIDCSNALELKLEGNKLRIDVTDFAQTWVDGKGYGLAIVPGLPGESAVVNDQSRRSELFPFQLSFINSTKADANRNPVPGRATGQIVFTPAEEDSDDGDLGDDLGGDLGLGDDFGTEVGLGDAGEFDTTGGDEFASGGLDDTASSFGADGGRPGNLGGAQLARTGGKNPGFSWALLFLLPIIAIAVWGAGSALGPLGDPVPVRQGGVGRLVARRQAGRTNS